MSLADDILEQTHGIVGAALHGDPGTLFLFGGAQLNLLHMERKDAEDEIDTGGAELEFDRLVVTISQQALGVNPDSPSPRQSVKLVTDNQPISEAGRTDGGARIIFDDEPDRTWYVRRILQHPRAYGYWELLCTDTMAPLD